MDTFIKNRLKEHWKRTEGYEGPIDCEVVEEDEDSMRFLVETEGNQFDVWVYSDGEIFLTATGCDGYHTLDGRPAVMMNGKPYLLDWKI